MEDKKCIDLQLTYAELDAVCEALRVFLSVEGPDGRLTDDEVNALSERLYERKTRIDMGEDG